MHTITQNIPRGTATSHASNGADKSVEIAQAYADHLERLSGNELDRMISLLTALPRDQQSVAVLYLQNLRRSRYGEPPSP